MVNWLEHFFLVNPILVSSIIANARFVLLGVHNKFSNYDLETVVCDLETVVCGLETVVCGLETVACGLETVAHDLETVACGLKTVVCNLETVVCNLETKEKNRMTTTTWPLSNCLLATAFIRKFPQSGNSRKKWSFVFSIQRKKRNVFSIKETKTIYFRV